METPDPELDTRRYLLSSYELQRDIDRLPGTTGMLYGGGPADRHCLVCLRCYEPSAREGDGGRGGRIQIYCSAACRARATDRRRRNLPREWRWCASCGGPFLALTLDSAIGPGRVVCPPSWPAPALSGHSECWEARRRATNRAAQARARARESAG